MVEQDLVLTRALVEIFSDRTLASAPAFRGGTALQKLVLPSPRRYSDMTPLPRSTSFVESSSSGSPEKVGEGDRDPARFLRNRLRYLAKTGRG